MYRYRKHFQDKYTKLKKKLIILDSTHLRNLSFSISVFWYEEASMVISLD